MTARGAALNPTSHPFFPGGLSHGSGIEERTTSLGFTPPHNRESERSSSSSISVSSSDYRSAGSSPSPPRDTNQNMRTGKGSLSKDSLQSLNKLNEDDEQSVINSRQVDEMVSEPLSEVFTDGEETPGPLQSQWSNSGRNFSSQLNVPELFSALPRSAAPSPFFPTGTDSSIGFNHKTTRLPSFSLKSLSPVSSTSSGVLLGPTSETPSLSIETQIKTSPLINEILDRISQYELRHTDIQRELSELHRKVNLLLDRSLGSTNMGSEPEFKNPFTQPSLNGHHVSSIGVMTSASALPPNQLPATKSDELNQLSDRLNSLTASVGHMLALQTQQHMNNIASNLSQGQAVFPSRQGSLDIPPNQIITPPAPQPSIPNHSLSNRPDFRANPRTPNPPMRNWSAGNVELPPRQSDSTIIRQDSLTRDKRKSIANVARRDSTGIMEPVSEHTTGNSMREGGPTISKWEHLPLAPELLRSLSKFGIGPPNKIQQRALPFLLRGADIIAQAPPTQERIAAYVIPAIHIALNFVASRPLRGPVVVMISTTVDQATQAQRMIRDLGGLIGVRSALGVGVVGPNTDVLQELRLLQQDMPHIICGTPQKLHSLFTTPGGIVASEVRFLVLDEVDQLIARNLHDFVFNIVKLFPQSRSRPSIVPLSQHGQFNPFDNGTNNASLSPPYQMNGRRFSGIMASPTPAGDTAVPTISQVERQTALFSNTVPQDVLNLANAIQLREPVRVLVRRDGNVTQAENNQSSRGLRQFYLYLAFTAGGRSDNTAAHLQGGLGIIGSGRSTSSAETAQAREWKLDALADLFGDLDVTQAIVHVGGLTALDAVVYKLASMGLEAVPLHSDMNAGTKLAALNKFKGSSSSVMRPQTTRVLVVYDVPVKAPDVLQVPLVINYDLPKAVEEYSHRVAPAISNNYSRAGVIVNFVTATGGDVEMLRSIECFYKIKCPEVPTSLRDIL